MNPISTHQKFLSQRDAQNIETFNLKLSTQNHNPLPLVSRVDLISTLVWMDKTSLTNSLDSPAHGLLNVPIPLCSREISMQRNFEAVATARIITPFVERL